MKVPAFVDVGLFGIGERKERENVRKIERATMRRMWKKRVEEKGLTFMVISREDIGLAGLPVGF